MHVCDHCTVTLRLLRLGCSIVLCNVPVSLRLRRFERTAAHNFDTLISRADGFLRYIFIESPVLLPPYYILATTAAIQQEQT